jgi:hypothetical protein
MSKKVFKRLKAGLEEAIDIAKEYRRIEDETEAKLELIRDAYMDGHIDSIEYQIEIDSLMEWNSKTIRSLSGDH